MAGDRIMVIDNEPGLCRMISMILEDQGYKVASYTKPKEALAAFQPGDWDLVISDVKMPEIDGLEVLQRLKSEDPALQVIMITAFATVEISIQALRQGALDMLTKPFEPEELIHRVEQALNHIRLLAENKDLKQELAGRFQFDNIIGVTSGLYEVLEKVKKIAIRDTSVLVTGESGTGKELIGQAIHYNSPRRDNRFIAINCGALPATLLESELFGHKKGAFTDAQADREGLLKAADKGTLFLDEVGNMPMNVQKTFLRFLQEQEFNRVGDTTPTRVNVRIISATNADLTEAVRRGDFREDLYYRLNVMNIHIPPLRERPEDIPLLTAHFIKEQNAKFGTGIRGLAPEAMEVAQHYHWPGNIRQLRNVIEASIALEGAESISLEVLSQFLEDLDVELTPSEPPKDDYNQALAQFETDYLQRLLKKADGNVEDAAKRAGMNMATVYRKLKKYGLKKSS